MNIIRHAFVSAACIACTLVACRDIPASVSLVSPEEIMDPNNCWIDTDEIEFRTDLILRPQEQDSANIYLLSPRCEIDPSYGLPKSTFLGRAQLSGLEESLELQEQFGTTYVKQRTGHSPMVIEGSYIFRADVKCEEVSTVDNTLIFSRCMVSQVSKVRPFSWEDSVFLTSSR